jgi:hypothetical protein
VSQYNSTDAVAVRLNDSDGTFGLQTNYAVSGLHGLTTADVNADGKQDIVATGHSNFSILPGNGTGTFGARVDHPLSVLSYSVTALAVDNDAWPDLATHGEHADGRVRVLRNESNGTLSLQFEHPTGQGGYVTKVDLDGDGDDDLAYTQFSAGLVGTLINGCK